MAFARLENKAPEKQIVEPKASGGVAPDGAERAPGGEQHGASGGVAPDRAERAPGGEQHGASRGALLATNAVTFLTEKQLQLLIPGAGDARKTLGSGGFGTVFAGFDAAIGPLAIKCFSETLTDPTSAVARRSHGLAEAANLLVGTWRSCDYVLTLHGICRNAYGKTVALVWEQASTDLGTLACDNDCSLGTLALLIADGIRGVAEIHRHDMIHRDLKPPNFLVFGLEGDSPRCRVADYDLVVPKDLYADMITPLMDKVMTLYDNKPDGRLVRTLLEMALDLTGKNPAARICRFGSLDQLADTITSVCKSV
ncbi:hypothetical protein GPECTOR_130g568 [Gonium pectorale]|uniref:Protein kinase domain-containing protein n=1 Tax=Gonium pectorale TaxID=33097 RepID=A0A150FYF9_GONPE|nr:hypothetical protein GPECTOR_130g568 [Gonium pectorale]|eukprot:KXZ42607.1 hypothetical protein GPECTOR_130g568 [Gonium pectorale]